MQTQCYYSLMIEKPLITIGVLSDTHLPYRMSALPTEIFDIFAGVDLILHAGDVDEAEFLHPLRQIAPVYAIRGNIHVGDLSLGGKDLPKEVHLSPANKHIVMVHGHRTEFWGLLLKIPEVLQSMLVKEGGQHLNKKIFTRLKKQHPDADVIIFGHTHVAVCQWVSGTLFFNPGAVAPSMYEEASVGILKIGAEKIEAEIIPLSSEAYTSLQRGMFMRLKHIRRFAVGFFARKRLNTLNSAADVTSHNADGRHQRDNEQGN